MKSCDNCAHEEVPSNFDPCRPCLAAPDLSLPRWEPKPVVLHRRAAAAIPKDEQHAINRLRGLE